MSKKKYYYGIWLGNEDLAEVKFILMMVRNWNLEVKFIGMLIRMKLRLVGCVEIKRGYILIYV